MVLVNTMEAARASRHEGELHNGTRYWRSDYFGRAGSPYHSPQGFYIEQTPGSVVPPHFHEVNQFQVIVAGGGTMGGHSLRPFAIHYSGMFTGYGPITAEPQGLCYFTLRPNSDSGAQFFPEAREKIKYTPARRNVMGKEAAPSPADVLKNLDEPECVTLIDGYDDGLGAWMLRLGAGGSAAAPQPSGGGGQYALVTGGALLHGEALLPELSCLFLSPEDPPLAARAGAAGLELLILQFPGG
jgi:hypothetical protein